MKDVYQNFVKRGKEWVEKYDQFLKDNGLYRGDRYENLERLSFFAHRTLELAKEEDIGESSIGVIRIYEEMMSTDWYKGLLEEDKNKVSYKYFYDIGFYKKIVAKE